MFQEQIRVSRVGKRFLARVERRPYGCENWFAASEYDVTDQVVDHISREMVHTLNTLNLVPAEPPVDPPGDSLGDPPADLLPIDPKSGGPNPALTVVAGTPGPGS